MTLNQNDPQAAWAAGLFEGEGSVSTRSGCPILQLKMCDREIVQRFRDAVDCGKVYGPYKNLSGQKDDYPRSDFYSWTASSTDCQFVVWLFWPWLGSARRSRTVEVGFAWAIQVA